MLGNIWVAEEIDFDRDDKDIKKLTEQEFEIISMILAFFNQSDILVGYEVLPKIIEHIPSEFMEIHFFYSLQVAVENIHSETYSQLIESYIKDEYMPHNKKAAEEKDKLFNAILHIPIVKKKQEWVQKNLA